VIKHLLYVRRSTDEEDRQILSIEAQLTELREFARKESLTVAKEFVESMTAKVPGRPVFNRMIEEIERGEATGILAWHPDRLARNSLDGGRIVYLLDTGKISSSPLDSPNTTWTTLQRTSNGASGRSSGGASSRESLLWAT
jgi:site-specific DNA recombinase